MVIARNQIFIGMEILKGTQEEIYAFLANKNRQGIPIVAKRVITEKNGVIDVKKID